MKNQPQSVHLALLQAKFFAFVLVLVVCKLTGWTQSPLQNHNIDSLVVRLSVLDNGQEKADILLEIAEIYGDVDCYRGQEYANLSLDLSEKLNYKRGILEAAFTKGKFILTCQADVTGAIPYLTNALQIAVDIEDQLAEMKILRMFAYASYSLGEYDNSIDYNLKALEIANSIQDKEEGLLIYGYLADTYSAKGDSITAKNYYESLYQATLENELDNANPKNLIILANYKFSQKAFAKANELATIAITCFKEKNDLRWLSYSYSVAGHINLALKNFDEAIDFGNKSLQISTEGKLNKERLDGYFLLENAYARIDKFEKAMFYQTQYYALTDSLNEIKLNSERLKFQKDFQNIAEQRENEKTKNELIKQQLEAENEKQFRQFWIVAFIAAVIALILIYYRLRQTNKLYKRLEVQKEELEKLSIVAANINQMVIIADKDNKIEWVNQAFERKFGYLCFEVVNHVPSQILSGEKTDRTKIKEINHKLFVEKIPFETTLVEYAKDGRYFINKLLVTPILDRNKELERYIVISQDITQQQKIAERLQELSLVASNTNNGIVIYNAERKITWVNEGFERLSGLLSEHVVGKGPLHVLKGTGGHKTSEIEEVLRKYEGGDEFTIERQIINYKEDNTKWISTTVNPVFNEYNELIKYVSVSTDITEIKTLQSQYSSLVEDSSDIIYETDIDGMFLFANDVASKLTGYSKEEIKTLNYLRLVTPEYRDTITEFYVDQIKSGKESSYIEFPIQAKDGTVFWVGQLARLKKNDTKDHVTGFSVITRDISEKKEAENELKRTYKNAHLLGEIGMQITSRLSVIGVIGEVYDRINQIMDATIFGIAIPNKTNDRLIFPEIIERGVRLENNGFSLSDDSRLGVICFKEAKEIVIGDHARDIKFYIPNEDKIAPAVAGDLPESLIYLPLLLRGKTIGVITVQSFNKNAFDNYQLNLLRSLATFVAIAMDNARLYETMEVNISERTAEVLKQKEELEINYFNTRILSEVGQMMASTLDLNQVFEQVYDKVKLLVTVDILAIILYDKEKQQIEYKYAMEKDKRYKPFTVSMDNRNNYAVWSILNRREIIIGHNTEEYTKYVNEIHIPEGQIPQSLIYYPMIVDNKVIGAITIQSFEKNVYKSYHLDILKTLASYTATLLSNSELYDSLEQKVKERTEELEQKNTDITSSINYAKRLQKGILPSKSFMKQLMPNSFVFFKPKDIVSGDFYWMDRRSSKILFAVVDCTGHGVPGAMMSIIGRNLLDQAVNEKGIVMPSQILNFLQVGLSVAFGQTEEGRVELFDGMDLALCSIDLKTNLLEFSGANSSLYLMQDGELLTIRGDKVGITAEYDNFPAYTNVEIEIKKGDTIYLSSDGFPDQFGGPRYKKYTYRRMKELLVDLSEEDSLDHQYQMVKDAHFKWKGDNLQTDDICLMGVRF